MSSELSITFVRVDDWEALYYDGKLSYEGHSINLADVLEGLDHCKLGPVEVRQYDEIDEAVVEQSGQFPQLLTQLDTWRQDVAGEYD